MLESMHHFIAIPCLFSKSGLSSRLSGTQKWLQLAQPLRRQIKTSVGFAGAEADIALA